MQPSRRNPARPRTFAPGPDAAPVDECPPGEHISVNAVQGGELRGGMLSQRRAPAPSAVHCATVHYAMGKTMGKSNLVGLDGLMRTGGKETDVIIDEDMEL